jgi:hypothetical protein
MKSEWWRKLLDEIKRKAKKIMIIEVKTSINYEAIEQIIVYRYFLKSGAFQWLMLQYFVKKPQKL